jgi:hypothetical protein
MRPDGSMAFDGGTLEGPLAFDPNSAFGLFGIPSESPAGDGGCFSPTEATLFLASSSPAFTQCLWLGQAPAGFEFEEQLEIQLATAADPTLNGTYALTADANALPDAGRIAFLVVRQNVAPLSSGTVVASAIAGTVSVQVVVSGTCDVEAIGSFSATMSDSDGGQSQLSGTIDTTLICFPI